MNFQLLSPHIFLFLWAIIVFVSDFFWNKKKKHNLGYLAQAGIVISFILIFFVGKGSLLGEMFVSDAFSKFFNLIFLGTAFLAISASIDFSKKIKAHQGEFFGLILLSTVGMMFLCSTGELITLYVSLELTTISLYVLSAYLKDNPKSAEAGLKYLILGAISSAVLLYGISLIYGLTGSTFFTQIKRTLVADFFILGHPGPILLFSFVFMIAGFGFKLALVPFHMWAPDVYEGAPTPITAYLSVASKTAGLAAFVRLFITSFLVYYLDWLTIIAVLAALAMIVGNIIAIQQKNIKRMLAYSSIAQIGYILIGVVAATDRGISSLAFYTLVYLFANMGAFIVVIAFSNQTNSDEIRDYAGLSRQSPVLAALMAVFMLSLVGIPPLAGFAGKYYLFSAAIDQGYVWLVIVAILTSVISLFYYMNVVREMYFQSSNHQREFFIPWGIRIALLLSFLGVIIGGIFPNAFLSLASQAASVFPY